MPVYFAYGSNMSTTRLRRRARSAVVVGRAYLEGYELRFNKRSEDGSGKANALETGRPSDRVEGLLFELTDLDLAELDRAEGRGYARAVARVETPAGATEDA